MNSKTAKKIRRLASIWVDGDKDLEHKTYKAIKKDLRKQVNMARSISTSNKPIQCP